MVLHSPEFTLKECSKVWNSAILSIVFDLSRYKEYEFIYNEDHAKFTPFYDKSIERLENILLDIYFMTECEYLVCTLSSNLGLLFYEIFSSKYDNLSERLVSLDREETLKYRLT